MNKIPMTIHGVEKLRYELKFLKNIRRKEIINLIYEARKHGDLKENAEYLAAKEQQLFCENRINEIENKLFHALIIDITKLPLDIKIIFGSTVVIKNINNQTKKTYRIVGDDEADFKKNLISIYSPLARGLIGKKEGDNVTILTPNGNIKFNICKVLYI